MLLRRGGTRSLQGRAIGFGRSRVREVENVEIRFPDVAGADEAVDELREVVDYLKHPERYTRIGARVPKGVLLVGPPGTGKTLLARAVAGEANTPFFEISGSEFVEMFVGVGAARVRDTFKQANQSAPCIIFIDEIDALGKARSAGGVSHEEREQALNQLLVEMDGFNNDSGIIVIAATNRPEVLDGALLRAGRFDRTVVVDKPGKDGRRDILAIHSKNVKLSDDVDMSSVAARTPGFVGADLANLVNEAALLAAREHSDTVTLANFDEAIERAALGLKKRGRLLSDMEKKVTAYHELGHAVVAERVPSGDPVKKVSIIPRGMSLGVMWQQPVQDTYMRKKSELEDSLAILMGGRAAEMLFFGEFYTGSESDLARATHLASDMVQKYGMSKLGGRTFTQSRTTHVNESISPRSSNHYSDAIMDEIDAEISRFVEHAHERALSILTKDRATIDQLATNLLEEQELSGKTLRSALTPKTTHNNS